MENKVSWISYVVFGFYMLLLIWLILFHLSVSILAIEQYWNINLMPYAQSAMVNGEIDISEIVYNVLVFVPVGAYLMMVGYPNHPMRNIAIGLFLSLLFETIQYIFALGSSDITDIVNNTIGVVVGVLIYILFGKFVGIKLEKLINLIVLSGSIVLVVAYLLLVFVN